MSKVIVHPEPFPIQSDTKCFYDCELYNNSFFVMCKIDQQYYLFSNPAKSKMLKTLWDKAIMIGFNNSSYDSRMVNEFLSKECEEVDYEELIRRLKLKNDEIISKQGNVNKINTIRQRNNHYDTKIGSGKKNRSLKEWELLLGMSVEESPIDFNADLDKSNKELAMNYCIHDIDATEMLFHKKCIENFNAIRILCEMAKQKVNYGKTIGSVTVDLLCYLAKEDKKTLGNYELFDYTDILDRVQRSGYLDLDEIRVIIESVREYELEGLPEVKDSYLGHINIGNLNIEIGAGGAHWCSRQKLWENCDDSDVTSMYPNIMLEYKIIDRTLGQLGNDGYREMIATRVANKKSNPELANALKIAINSVYGKMSGEGGLNDVSGRLAVCIIGQLALCDLVARYMKHIPGCQIAQMNTDGVIYKFDKEKYKAKADKQMAEWSELFGMGLETVNMDFLYQHNINNYVAEVTEGDKKDFKFKGGFFKSSNGTKEYIYKSLIHYALHNEKPNIKEYPNSDFIEIVKTRKVPGTNAQYEILVNGECVPNKLVPFVKTVGGVPIAFRNPINGKVSGNETAVNEINNDDVEDSFTADYGITEDYRSKDDSPKTLPKSCTVIYKKDDAFKLKPDYEALNKDVDDVINSLKSDMKEPKKIHWKDAWQKEKIKQWIKKNDIYINTGILPPGYKDVAKFLTELEMVGLSKKRIDDWHKKNLAKKIDTGEMF